MWPFTLSGRLCIIALVSRYLTNQLMHRRIIHVQGRSPFNRKKMPPCHLSGFSRRFHLLSRAHGQIPYVLLTRSPLTSNEQAHLPSVRLACIRHAASVHPEPGSNSPFDLALTLSASFSFFLNHFRFGFELTFSCLVFKDRLLAPLFGARL